MSLQSSALDTPNVGMLIGEKNRYNDKPQEVVNINTEGTNPPWKTVRAEIQKMTHVGPKERASTSEVVQSLEMLTSAEEMASPPAKAIGLANNESDPDARHAQPRNVVEAAQSAQSEDADTSAPEEHDEPSQLEHGHLTETDPPDSDPPPAGA